ncbi:MAG: hypothetical protein HKL80_00240, partial [Acidimicrobiales bacterium]|nr:hypothetical protein [Acidimicrobiales bacterium]
MAILGLLLSILIIVSSSQSPPSQTHFSRQLAAQTAQSNLSHHYALANAGILSGPSLLTNTKKTNISAAKQHPYSPTASPSELLSSSNSWQSIGILSGRLLGSSCPTYQVCFAIGEAAYSQSPLMVETINGGATWSNVTLPSAVADTQAIDCPTILECIVVGNSYWGFGYGIFQTPNAGITWNVSAPNILGGLATVTCPSSLVCYAGGKPNPSIIISTDGGITWNPTSPFPPAEAVSLSSIACPAIQFCIAVGLYSNQSNNGGTSGGLIYYTSNFGTTWQSVSVSSDFGTFNSVSCPSSTWCMATGANLMGESVTADLSFSSQVLVSTSFNLSPNPVGSEMAIFCQAVMRCLMAGGTLGNISEISFTSDGGSSISVETVPSPSPDLDQLQCGVGPVLWCIVSGSNQDNSTTWFYGANTYTPEVPNLVAPAISPSSQSNLNPINALVLGDSIAKVIGIGLNVNQSAYGLQFGNQSAIGCGIVGIPTYIDKGNVSTNRTQCASWQSQFLTAVSYGPKIVVLLVGRWESYTYEVNNSWVSLGNPIYDQIIESSLRQAISILSSNGAHVILVTEPSCDSGGQLNGTPWSED